MSDFIITSEGLSKRYRLGKAKNGSSTLGGQVADLLLSPVRNFNRLRSLRNLAMDESSTFWALKDVNFQVKQGEVLGVIGHNGAGKSTLLKILSRITEPTHGLITIKGRISALLEVGTGFHPELSGRENIYMNGTILGLRKREIDRKIDEIIAFSGVERHIDTPVKFYSSGMKVRLGFSVAAHLEPEILIIDEVLSVGDLEFQKKCLGKMENVAGSGRTVLFVSHSMSAIRHLCTRAMVLRHGSVDFDGNVEDAINAYVSQSFSRSLGNSYNKLNIENNPVEVIEAQVADSRQIAKAEFNADEDIFVLLKIAKNQEIPGIKGYLLIRNEADEAYIESDTYDFLPNVLDELALGEHNLELKIARRVLPKGKFKVYLNFTSNFSTNFTLDSPKDILSFEVYDTTTSRGANRKAYTNAIVEWRKVQ